MQDRGLPEAQFVQDANSDTRRHWNSRRLVYGIPPFQANLEC
jgi:hypothetical protein